MKSYKQKPDFLYIGNKLLSWYKHNARELPWRKTKDPYKIWISEIILQQTQVKQGHNYYLNFIEKFPNVKALAEAHLDTVLLYWKGLGYYSRALNLHKASQQIVQEYGGNLPDNYTDLLKLKGIGKYTAAAISSICFDEKKPAIDGNFYRVLSRIFADDFNISNPNAFNYYTELALKLMPEKNAGDFNQAIMDLGSEICKPKQPNCNICPINEDCLAFNLGKTDEFPKKNKKQKSENLSLKYYFISYKNCFLIKQRAEDFIWKKLYEFPTQIPENWIPYTQNSKTINHKLTHKNLLIEIDLIVLPSLKDLESYAKKNAFLIVTKSESDKKTFPKPLENYLEALDDKLLES